MRRLAPLCLVLAACSNQAFSPPAGWVPAEEPLPVERGRTTVGGSLGFGTVGLDAADFVGGDVRVRRGLGELTELQVGGALVAFTEETDESPVVGSVRVGMKGLFAKDLPHLAWVGGLGGGASAGGWFAATDLGLQVGYVNPTLTPWFGISGVASVPLSSEDVDLRRADDTDPNIDHPVFSGGVRWGVGLTAHLAESRATLTLAYANLRLWDIHGVDEAVSAVTLAFDVPL